MIPNYLEYQLPTLKNSTREISVKDRYGTQVLTIQKYFKNTFQRILNAIIPSFNTNIKIIRNSEIIADSVETPKLGRRSWDIQFKNENGQMKTIKLQDTRVVRTQRKASFNIENNHYKLERGFGQKTTEVLLNGEIIAEMTYDKAVPPRHNTLNIYKDNLNIALLLCILHTFELTS